MNSEANQRNHIALDAEREGYDERMDWAETLRNRRTLHEYFISDFPMALIRFSYFRSSLA